MRDTLVAESLDSCGFAPLDYTGALVDQRQGLENGVKWYKMATGEPILYPKPGPNSPHNGPCCARSVHST